MFVYEADDRVAAVVEGKALKGRVVAPADELGLVAVTFSKGGEVKLFNVGEVFPLVRYERQEDGSLNYGRVLPLCMIQNEQLHGE